MHGEDHHPRRGGRLEDLRDDLDALAAGHVEIEQEDVGLVSPGVAHRRVRFLGLGDHFDASVALEKQAQPFANDGMVISQHHGHRLSFH